MMPTSPIPTEFVEIHDAFQAGQRRSRRQVHRAMIETYLSIGSILARKTREDGWTETDVQKLSEWLIRNTTTGTTFMASNLQHMRRFHEAWSEKAHLLSKVHELSWPCHRVLLERCATDRDRERFLLAALNGKWTPQELEARIRDGVEGDGAPEEIS